MSSVADPHHFDADPDPAFDFDVYPDPTFHSDANPDPTFNFIRILILPLTFPDLDPPERQINDTLWLPSFHFYADPDLAFHFGADPDLAFHLMRIRIQLPKMMRIPIRKTGHDAEPVRGYPHTYLINDCRRKTF